MWIGGPGWRFRRVRKVSKSERPGFVEGLIWRSDAPAALGRANPAGYQVLYLADRVDTALAETHVVDEAVVVSEFSIQHHRSVRIAPVGELMQIQRTGSGFLSGEHSEVVGSMLNVCGIEEGKSLVITDTFLHECLTSHDNYEISSHVAMCLFEKHPMLSVVAYTSRRQAGALCFAVKVEDFWQNWSLVAVRHARAQHLARGVFRLSEITGVTGIHRNGTLVWGDSELSENMLPELRPPFSPQVS
jgi:RES domain-containing protein